MARPRKHTDEHLLSAATAVVRDVGPTFTLADIAAHAQISAGTLVHRFGSKHGLLTAMLNAAIDAVRQEPPPPTGDDPTATIRHTLVDRYQDLDDPGTAANSLALLAHELADEQLREALADLHAAIDASTRTLLQHAIDAGALPGAPPTPIAARILTATVDGTALRWSARPDGSLRDRLHTDLDAILAGWRR